MKHNTVNFAPLDYAHYMEQHRLNIAMFEHLSPNNNLADKGLAQNYLTRAQTALALAVQAYASDLFKQAQSYASQSEKLPEGRPRPLGFDPEDQ